jgi:hypothetical protein
MDRLEFRRHRLSSLSVLLSDLGDAVHPCHLHPHGEGPDEPALERLLRDHPEVFVAKAVQQEVDRSVDGEEEVGDHRSVVHPDRPGLRDGSVPQNLKTIKEKVRYDLIIMID